MPEHILVLILAGPKYDKLNRVLAHLVHHIGDQVESLLIRQTGDNANQHGLVVYSKSQLLLERRFVLHFFLPEVAHIIVPGNVLVCLRIVVFVIDAVDDPRQTVGSCVHQAVQSLAVEGHLDLLRVGVADGSHPVRIDDAALQIIGILVGLQLVRREIIFGKPGDVHHPLGIPHALELQVMYGHDGLDPPEVLIPVPEVVKIHRDQTGLPVMAVDDVRTEIKKRQRA